MGETGAATVPLAQDGSEDWIGADCPSGFACVETAVPDRAEGPRSDGGGKTADVVVDVPTVSALLVGEGAGDLGFKGADAG